MTDYIIWPCKQTAVYWEFSSFDDYGKPSYEEPIEIACRWDDITQEFINPHGDRTISRSMVIVSQLVKTKGYLFLGSLTDLTDEDIPMNNTNAWEIQQINDNPDIVGKKHLITAYL